MMNRLVKSIAILMIAMVLGSCTDSENVVTINGVIIAPMEEGIVLFQKYGDKGLVTIDTVDVDAEGRFTVEIVNTTPDFYSFNFYNRKGGNVVLDGSESNEIELTVDMSDDKARTTVTGSSETDHLAFYNELIDNMTEDQNLINTQGNAANRNNDEAELEQLKNEYLTLLEEFYDNIKSYSFKIQPSLAVFYGIASLRPQDHFEFYDSLATIYGQAHPDHPFTKNIIMQTDQLRAMNNAGVKINESAPEIALETPEGDVLTLSSLKGNYVLIDFWAAWCRPCRVENPNVVRVYNQYKDKNFEILGVSLDRSKEAWLKAINDDGLTWKHVSDLKYFNSQAAQDYGVNAIPATYLIGPDGKVIAKGLRGASLEAKLKEIFG